MSLFAKIKIYYYTAFNFFFNPWLIIFPKIDRGELLQSGFPERIFAIVSGTGYITG